MMSSRNEQVTSLRPIRLALEAMARDKRLQLKGQNRDPCMIGKTKVFLRAGQMAELDARRSEAISNGRVIETSSNECGNEFHHLSYRGCSNNPKHELSNTPKMKDTAKSTGVEGRIVNLSSVAHLHSYPEGIAFEKINDKNSYDEKRAYVKSKIANLLHANELSRRLQGAATTCYVALHPSLKGVSGKYYVDCNEFEMSKFARNEDLAKKLWDFSYDLVNAARKPSS
ncbi:hypothetical protein ACS0TY_015382 [Phlomoides rotata]